MATLDYQLTITRLGQIVKHKNDQGTYDYGELSRLEVKGLLSSYYALERRGGYVTLPPGLYTIKMETSPKAPSRRHFRVLNHTVWSKQNHRLAAILAHAGRFPGHVTGCIAPGKVATGEGVKYSTTLMQEIFEHFGGFAVGTEAQLQVVGAPAKVVP
jgi:hypothetical protein